MVTEGNAYGKLGKKAHPHMKTPSAEPHICFAYDMMKRQSSCGKSPNKILFSDMICSNFQ